MNSEKIFLASKAVELSEHKTYIELKNRLCYYDEPNLNGVKLPYETAEEKAQTLIEMPVVAKYKKNMKGQDDLGSHECYVDSNGDVQFGTENIGVHTAVEVKDDEVEINGITKTLPCLFANSKIWTRNKNVVNAIKRLFNEGKLFSSWEIISTAFTFENGIKTLTDYMFESNCLLGENVAPAYGSTSCALGLASVQNSELLIAEALATDINTSKEQEENNLADKENVVVGQSEEVTEAPVVEETNADEATKENKIEEAKKKKKCAEKTDNEEDTDGEDEKFKSEVSALTEWDLRDKICIACKAKLNKWCWVSFHFPIEKTVWVEVEGRESELDFVLFTYECANNEITISEPQNVKLTVSIAELNSTIAQKDEALLSANEKIQELSTEVSNLKPFKEACEKAEQERIEAETAQKRIDLKAKVEKSNLFTEDEIESTEISSLIETVDEAAIRNLMADKFMASLEGEKETVETSEVKVETAIKPKANIDNSDEGTKFSIREFLSAYSHK